MGLRDAFVYSYEFVLRWISMIKQTFLGISEPSWGDAKTVIIPVPYDAMTSYNPGARNGPDAILRASQQVETYDEELKRDLDDLPVFTRDPLFPEKSSPQAMIEAVEEAVEEVAGAGKLPVLLGGDHSLSIAPTRYFAKKYKPGRTTSPVPTNVGTNATKSGEVVQPGSDFAILHIDAHTDLRKEYEGSSFSHACAMRPAYEMGVMLVQVGIRSTPKEVDEECVEHRKVFLAPLVPVDEIIKALPLNVYVSFDVDSLDPSIMPATGTPEPGGLSWQDVLKLFRAVARERNVVGFDIMELSPIPGLIYPEFTIARLLAKFFGYQFREEGNWS